MQNLHTKGAKIAPVGVQKLHSRGAKIAPNIYIDNKIDIIKDNNTQTAFDINN